jgi:hypothetical protein
MMNMANLWWIVPICIFIGYGICAIIRTGKDADERMDEIMRREKVVTVVATKDSDETGTVTINGIDQYVNERTETINVPGQSKGVYVSIKGKDGGEHE